MPMPATMDPRRSGHGRGHPLQAVHEQKGSREVRDADDELRKDRQHVGSSTLVRVTGPGMAVLGMGWLVPAGLEHRQHAMSNGEAASGIPRAEQDGQESDRLLQHRAAFSSANIPPTTTMPCTKFEPESAGCADRRHVADDDPPAKAASMKM